MTDQPASGSGATDDRSPGEVPGGHRPPSAPYPQQPNYSQPPGSYGPAYGPGEQYPPYTPSGQSGYYGQPPGFYGAAYGPGEQYSPYTTYGQPAYYGQPARSRGLSIASLCCGVAVLLGFGFFLLPQVAAVVLGHMALVREPAGRAMAIAGLVMGYLGIALTVLVIVALFQYFGGSASQGAFRV